MWKNKGYGFSYNPEGKGYAYIFHRVGIAFCDICTANSKITAEIHNFHDSNIEGNCQE